MENRKIYLTNHLKIFDSIITSKRFEMINIINQLVSLNNLKNVLDVGTTSDYENPNSNLIVKNLKNIKKFYSISNQTINSPFFEKALKKSIVDNLDKEEIEEFKSDLVISTATIEHVGSFENQRTMIKNMIKLSKEMIIITTPNRFHPIEFHTKIPFIHWLPRNVHRKILQFLNLTFYAKEENLNLLSKSDFIKLVEGEDIDYGFKFVNLFFCKSNLIFIAKKFKS